MKKVLLIMLALVCALGLAACTKKENPPIPPHTSSVPDTSTPSGSSEVSPAPGTSGSPNDDTGRTGQANGYGGLVTATVIVDNDKRIADLVITAPYETEAVAGDAIKELTETIKRVGTTIDVDTIAGATITSQAIIDAVNNAIDPEGYPYEEPASKAPTDSSAPISSTPSSAT